MRTTIDETKNNNSSSNGSTFLQYCYNLNIAFIVLDLCGVIDWPWYCIMAPIWIPLALIVLAAILGAIVGGNE